MQGLPTVEGYSVVDGKKQVVAGHPDLLKALPLLREQSGRAELYRNKDGMLIAWVSGSTFTAQGRRALREAAEAA